MKDPYMDTELQVNRLFEDYKKYGRLIVAYDYDNTVFDYHKKGYHFPAVMHLLQKAKRLNCELICFTASPPERFSEIREYLEEWQVPCDKINEQPDFAEKHNTRKVYYSIFLDDRAGLGQAVDVLCTTLMKIEKEIKQNENRI